MQTPTPSAHRAATPTFWTPEQWAAILEFSRSVAQYRRAAADAAALGEPGRARCLRALSRHCLRVTQRYARQAEGAAA